MKFAWEAFKAFCVLLVVISTLHDLLVGVVHADPVYWINW